MGSASTPPTPAVEQARLAVPGFGGLLSVTSSVGVEVVAACVQTFPHLDTAVVAARGEVAGLQVQVHQQGDRLEVSCFATTPAPPLATCRVEVPMVHGVEVVAVGAAGVEVRDMVEGPHILLGAEQGAVTVSGVKTEELRVVTEGGPVRCEGAVQGRVALTTTTGAIAATGRILGPELRVTTEQGEVEVANTYSDSSTFTATRGSIRLKNLHNRSRVEVVEEGEVVMTGVDGQTEVLVGRGMVDVAISRLTGDSRVEVGEGHVVVRLATSHPLTLEVEAREVALDSTFQGLGEMEEGGRRFRCTLPHSLPGPVLLVVAGGRVEVVEQSWAQGLGLKLSSTDADTVRDRQRSRFMKERGNTEAWTMEDLEREGRRGEVDGRRGE